MGEIIQDYRFHLSSLGIASEILRSYSKSLITPSEQPVSAFAVDSSLIESLGEVTEEDLTELTYQLRITYSFYLIAATEGYIRLYYNNVRKRPNSHIQRALKKVFSLKKNRAGLEDEILGTVKELFKINNYITTRISDYVGLLKLRHWVAHGRYWDPNLERQDPSEYDPEDVYEVLNKMLVADFNIQTT